MQGKKKSKRQLTYCLYQANPLQAIADTNTESNLQTTGATKEEDAPSSAATSTEQANPTEASPQVLLLQDSLSSNDGSRREESTSINT
jgi:hypothetical protein